MLAITVMMCGILIRLSTWHQKSTNSALEPRPKNWSGDDAGGSTRSGNAGGKLSKRGCGKNSSMSCSKNPSGDVGGPGWSGGTDGNYRRGCRRQPPKRGCELKNRHLFEGQTCHGAAPTWHPHCHPKSLHWRLGRLSTYLRRNSSATFCFPAKPGLNCLVDQDSEFIRFYDSEDGASTEKPSEELEARSKGWRGTGAMCDWESPNRLPNVAPQVIFSVIFIAWFFS